MMLDSLVGGGGGSGDSCGVAAPLQTGAGVSQDAADQLHRYIFSELCVGVS